VSPWGVDPIAVAAGELSAPERAEADRLLREDPAFRVEVERVARVTGALTALPAEAWTASAPPPPPLDLAKALAARPAAEEPVAAAPASAPLGASPEPEAVPAHGRRRRGAERGRGASRTRRAPRVLVLRPLSAALAGLALLAAGAGAALVAAGGDAAPGTVAQEPPAPPPARVVALEPLAPVAAGSERARVALPARAGGTVRVALDGIAPLPRGEHLELWLLRDGEDMVSLGTFRAGADGRVRATLPLGVDPARARFVDVSVERDDGDPTHSRRSVLRSAALS
jgi:anti-sigma-K factor RskA